MSKDQAIGALIFIASLAGIIIYGWLLFFVAPMLVIQITFFIAVLAILAILAWIGYTMATTQPLDTLDTEHTMTLSETSSSTTTTSEAEKQDSKQ